MRPHLSVLAAVLILGGPGVRAAAPAEARPVYVIPIEDEIERGLVYVVRRGVGEARRAGAAVIILDMDTFGGRVDAAIEIVETIGALKTPTYTFVRRNAASAGALIALGTDHIYMAPGSSIGAATPVAISPIGDAQKLSESVEEKNVSYIAGVFRSTAQRKNHDPLVAEAMVRRDVEYKIGDEVVSAKGRLLTLTNQEAERRVGAPGAERPLLSEGTLESLNALVGKLGFEAAAAVRVKATPYERLARYIEMFSALFLIGGIVGLYIEMKTPGFGLPGTVGLILLAIWFWGYHVAGLAGMEEMLVFMAGLALLLIELFATPGFGLLGIAGIGMMLAALIMSMVEHYPGTPWFRPPRVHLEGMLYVLAPALAGITAAGCVVARFLPGIPLLNRVMLRSDVGTRRGYSAAQETRELDGLAGTALTPLRPGGIGVFGGRRLDVVTEGDFIEPKTPISIVRTEGNRIIVTAVSSGETAQRT